MSNVIDLDSVRPRRPQPPSARTLRAALSYVAVELEQTGQTTAAELVRLACLAIVEPGADTPR